jgi:hypothetical protein
VLKRPRLGPRVSIEFVLGPPSLRGDTIETGQTFPSRSESDSMSQELQDLQAALDAERVEHDMTRAMLVSARAALVSEAVAHSNTRVELTTTQAVPRS